MSLWRVDAAAGGGQLLRSALTVAALSGRRLELSGIRLGRPKPGLQRQHLTAVEAMVAATGGHADGARLGATSLTFEPGDDDGPIHRHIDIGTAGSTTLVVQTLLPLLARRGGRIEVVGGTDNPMAPPVDYLREVFVPALAELGVEVSVTLYQRGYYPVGGGCLVAECAAQPAWRGPDRVDWTPPLTLGGVIYSSRLPTHVTDRLRNVAATTLANTRSDLANVALGDLRVREGEPAASPGCGIVLWATDQAGYRVSASALGEKGKPAEEVGREAAESLLAELHAAVPCDRHLGDQLALWAALAEGPTRWRTTMSNHLSTSLDLLHDGLGTAWEVDDGLVQRS